MRAASLISRRQATSLIGAGVAVLAAGKTAYADKRNNTLVYAYRLTIFERHDEKFRGIHTQYVQEYRKDLVNTIGHIKTTLIRERNALPNPAVYCIETPLVVPVDETLLPIAKRSLVKYIAGQAA